MDRHAIWKWLVLIALTAVSLAVVTPIKDKVKLGLDLRGGTSFVLEVDTSELTEDALKDAQERALEVISNRIDPHGVLEPIIYPEPSSKRIVAQIPGLKAADRDRIVQLIQSAAFLEFRMVHSKNEELIDELFEKGLVPDGYKVVSLDEQLGNGQWINVDYYKRDKALDPEGADEDEIEARLRRFHAPAGCEMLLMEEERQGQKLFRPYFVSKRRELTGESLKNASVDYQQFGQPIVSLKFDSKGARKFANVTSDYAPGGAKNPSLDGRKYLGIVLDGTLYSAPFIKTAIHGGEAIIEGSFSIKEAQDLAIVLRAGALPAPVKVVEERGVDPSLGRDSIASGKLAAIYGGLAVVVFMMAYYMLAGVIANVALLLDILLLPLGMLIVGGFMSLLTGGSRFGGGAISLPTLTLPGIAGIALTIGMAVDANVLIYERIREELATGKRLASAIAAGYDRAFSCILDSNLTTFLTAIILYVTGSGAIRGFAVTLSAGILVSMYTALVVTRMLFNLITLKTKISTLKMLCLIKDCGINFLGKRYVAIGLSLALIIGTGVMFVLRGQDNFGVDFTGGRSVVFRFSEKQPVEAVRDALAAAGVGETFIQYQKELVGVEGEEPKEFLEIKAGFDQGDAARETILRDFADAGYEVVREDSVGPQVGQELKKTAVKAIVAALIGIVIYLSIRFEFAFAIGAIVALAHDVLITVGLYCLLGRQLSLPIVAALLTIVGYSVNDTIVVFDRIREDLKLLRGKPYMEIANLSINQTLSRTVLTSLTTLLTVAALLIFGGGAVFDFALTLFIGITVGTYSSIFIATPVMLLWHREKPKAA